MSGRRLKITGLIVLGAALLQAAWVLTIPAFRGIDEFDHAYRASSVAHGYWDVSQAPAGRSHGYLIPAKRDIVRAASEVCFSYRYTSADNCSAQRDLHDDLVLVSSGAARYNPLFYAIIGYASKAATGIDALYIMRCIAALLCGALLAGAVRAATLWAKSSWPTLSLVVALTPVSVYSMSQPAPNGIEMAASLALWTSGLGLTCAETPRVRRELLVIFAAASCPLAVTRSLGPLWLVLIVAAILMVGGRRGLGDLRRTNRRALIVALTVVALAAIAGGIWTRLSGSNAPPEATTKVSPPTLELILQLPLWVFQSIAAFPTRNEPAPTIIYSIGLLTALPVVILGLRRAGSRVRFAGTFVVGAGFGIPLALTWLTYSSVGFAWQGRYTLPLTYGLIILAGYSLDRALVTRWRTPITAFTIVMVGAMHIGSLIFVYRREATNPLFDSVSWPMTHLWVVVALSLAGIVLWWVGLAAGKDMPHKVGQRASVREPELVTRRRS